MIKQLIDEKVLTKFKQLSENDTVLKRVVELIDNDEKFINALIVSVLIIREQEIEFKRIIDKFVSENSEIEKILNTK